MGFLKIDTNQVISKHITVDQTDYTYEDGSVRTAAFIRYPAGTIEGCSYITRDDGSIVTLSNVTEPVGTIEATGFFTHPNGNMQLLSLVRLYKYGKTETMSDLTCANIVEDPDPIKISSKLSSVTECHAGTCVMTFDVGKVTYETTYIDPNYHPFTEWVSEMFGVVQDFFA